MQQQFQDYDLITEISKSMSSTTYLANARDKLENKVILKIFKEAFFTHSFEKKQFLSRVETLKHIQHPHFVPILEAGIEEENAYSVSKYMTGGSLRVRLDREYPKQLPFQQAMLIISQIAQTLIYLHTHQIVHGQIKPEHILFDTSGQALLADASLIESVQAGAYQLKNTAYAFRYMSPEQILQEGNFLSDQYALCCVAYELFTGQPPFIEMDVQELKRKQIEDQPLPLSDLVSSLPALVETTILRGLSKAPSERYPDLATFLATLQPVLQSSPTLELPLPRSRRQTTGQMKQPGSSPRHAPLTPNPISAPDPVVGNMPDSQPGAPSPAGQGKPGNTALFAELTASGDSNAEIRGALSDLEMLAEGIFDPLPGISMHQPLPGTVPGEPQTNSASDDSATLDEMLEDMSRLEDLFISRSLGQSSQLEEEQSVRASLPTAQAPGVLASSTELAKKAQILPSDGARQTTFVPQSNAFRMFRSQPYISPTPAFIQPPLAPKRSPRLVLWATTLLVVVCLVAYSLLTFSSPSSPSVHNPPSAGTNPASPVSTTTIFVLGTETVQVPPTTVNPGSTTTTPANGGTGQTSTSPGSGGSASGGGQTNLPTPTPTPKPTPTPIPVVSSLSVSYQEYNTFTNLTSAGNLDWVHWGLKTQYDVNRKANVTPLIAVSSYGSGGFNATHPIDFGWSDGTPTQSMSTTTSCLYIDGANNGFTLTVPASTSTRTLRFYVGVDQGQAQLSASIQGGGSYYNDSLNMIGDPNKADNALYTLVFKSNTPGTKLVVTWTLKKAENSEGSVLLESAALSG